MLICAEERFSPISSPKSIVSFQAGLRASGKSSTADDAADPHVDAEEVLEVDLGSRLHPREATRLGRSR